LTKGIASVPERRAARASAAASKRAVSHTREMMSASSIGSRWDRAEARASAASNRAIAANSCSSESSAAHCSSANISPRPGIGA
jgi:hypothetical protein